MLFNRIISATVGGFQTSDLRVNFDIKKDSDSNANYASVQIYNMSENSRNNIRELDDTLIIAAGYQDDVGEKIIFIGDVTDIDNRLQPPDIITALEAGDGVRALRESRESVSFKEGTQAGNILNEIANNLGLTLKQLPTGISAQYVHGFSHAGSVKDALNKVTDRLNLEWSIQNNELQILEQRSVLPGPAIRISSQTGLIERPEKIRNLRSNLIERQPNPGYKFKTLLNPDIEPGLSVMLEGIAAPGEFRVETVNHLGDNFANDFVTIVEALEI